MSKGKFALGALIGAAAGVVAGLLTAPKSGKETQADLKEAAGRLETETKAKATKVKSSIDSGVKKATKEANEKIGETKEAAKDLKQRSEKAYKAGKKAFKENK